MWVLCRRKFNSSKRKLVLISHFSSISGHLLRTPPPKKKKTKTKTKNKTKNKNKQTNLKKKEQNKNKNKQPKHNKTHPHSI